MLFGSKIKTPSWRLLIFSVLVVCSHQFGVAQDAIEPDSEFKIVEAGPFRIHVPAGHQELADRSREIGIQTWEIASKLYGSKLPEKKLDVYLYRTIEDYLAAEDKLTGGKFKKNQAFAHFNTFTAHVALQPPISDDLLSEVGLPIQSARLLAHEMAHLVRFKRMPNTFRDHPYWLIDGMASLVDQRVLKTTGYLSDWKRDPNFGAYAWNGKRLLRENKLPSATNLLSNETLDVSFYDRYSIRWIFADMLAATYGSKFEAFLKELGRLGGGTDYSKRTQELLLEHLKVDAETLDQQFVKHIEQLAPQWCELGRSFETFGPTWHQIAFPDSTATTWRQKPLGQSFHVTTTATIHESGRKQLNIRIGQRDSFTQFSVTAGYGLNVFEFSDKKWETKLAKKISGIKIGQAMALSLKYDYEKAEAVLELDGKVVLQEKMKLEVGNLLALGAQKGSAVTWQDFEAK